MCSRVLQLYRAGMRLPVIWALGMLVGCPRRRSAAASALSAALYSAQKLAAQYACTKPLLNGNSLSITCTGEFAPAFCLTSQAMHPQHSCQQILQLRERQEASSADGGGKEEGEW